MIALLDKPAVAPKNQSVIILGNCYNPVDGTGGAVR